MNLFNRRGLWMGVLVGSVPLFALANGCGPEFPEQTPDGGVIVTKDSGTTVEPEKDAGTQMQTPDSGMQHPMDAGMDAGMQMPTDAGLSFSRHIQPILNGCTGCHAAGMGAQGGLSLTKELSHAALVNMANSSMGLCKDHSSKRVTPGDPNKSLLYLKLSATPPCGVKMPIGGTLEPAKLGLIRVWIEEGAKNN